MNILRSFSRMVPLIVMSVFSVHAASGGTAAVAGREIRHITPPRLEATNIKREVLCHRPMRNGSPRTNVELVAGHVVANNAGHGGSGWTLAPGSAEYVNTLLEKSALSADLTKETPITIIGAGVLGLFSAYDLIKRGYTNITIVAENFENLTSHNAGGLVAPVSMNNAPELQKIVDKMGVDAYKFFASVARGENADLPKEGALIVPTYFETLEESGFASYIEAGVMNPATAVTLDFSTGTTRDMVAFDDGIFVDTSVLMHALGSFLRDSSFVKFEQRKVSSFAEVPTKYIINCTGLGAAELLHDDEFVSVQGHLLMLKDQNPADLQYMILVYFGKVTNAHGQEVKRSFYLFPKRDAGAEYSAIGVMGGTFIEGATPATPNEEEFAQVVKGAKEFYGLA